MIRDGTRGGKWTPFLWIVLASAAAHLWCLGSQFYMDDIPQIRDSAAVLGGDFAKQPLLAWTTFWWVVQFRVFGMSPVGFHAVNWLLHTGVACALFVLGRDFLRGKSPVGVALFGALLFAVHPLGSEIPNYARTQDLAWVTLFSLLAGWFLLNFLRSGGWWRAAACIGCIVGAALSKGPGIFHAGMVCAAIGLAALSPEQWRFLRKRAWPIAGAVVLSLAALWLGGFLDRFTRATAAWAEPRFIGHAYTLARVFWEFAWRAVLPIALSSDHLVTETLIPPGTHFWNVPDKIAMLAMAGLLALTAISGWLAWRKSTREFGVCLLLFVTTILFRFLYPVPEFMPEYRIYPGLPWFCLGAAIVLAGAWRWLFETVPPLVPAVVLLGGFALLSARRSFVWHDVHRLAGDVLQRYPARARAIWEMDDRDADFGNWQAIADRQRDAWPEVERRFVAGNERLAPAREIPSGDFVFAMIGIFGNHALALAHLENPAAGLRAMAQLEAHMRTMRMTPETKPVEWNHFLHDKALILEMAGKYDAALACLRQPERPPEAWQTDIARISKKLPSH